MTNLVIVTIFVIFILINYSSQFTYAKNNNENEDTKDFTSNLFNAITDIYNTLSYNLEEQYIHNNRK
jgi:tryptophan-rich sensory protein